jgi:hypothetical protein
MLFDTASRLFPKTYGESKPKAWPTSMRERIKAMFFQNGRNIAIIILIDFSFLFIFYFVKEFIFVLILA